MWGLTGSWGGLATVATEDDEVKLQDMVYSVVISDILYGD